MNIEEMFNNCPDDPAVFLWRNLVGRFAADPENRKMLEDSFKDDPEKLKAIQKGNEMAALNDQVINVLGTAKHLLADFDENDHNPFRATENLKFFFLFTSITGVSMSNLMQNLDAFYKGSEDTDG